MLYATIGWFGETVALQGFASDDGLSVVWLYSNHEAPPLPVMQEVQALVQILHCKAQMATLIVYSLFHTQPQIFRALLGNVTCIQFMYELVQLCFIK